MSLKRVIAKAAVLGFKKVLSEHLLLLGNFIMYAILIIAYGGIFRSVSGEELIFHKLSQGQMVWYIGITEFVLFCGSLHFRELQYDVQNDHIYLEFLRPCPPWVVRLSEWGGQFIARFIILACPCFMLTSYIAGVSLPTFSVLGIIASLPIAGVTFLVWNFLLGISCRWIKQADPAYWIWQKSLFLLGALLWPLSIYPPLLSKIVWVTPFPATLAVPGQWALDISVSAHLGGALHQVLWGAVFIFLASVASRALFKHIQEHG